MTYYYQLIFLGNTGLGACLAIRNRFMTIIKEFGVDESCVKVILAKNFAVDYFNCQPSFAFYLGDAADRDKDVALLQTLLSNGDTVYPLFFKENGFLQETPDCIHDLNGHQYLDDDIDKYVNCALESLRLLRRMRRVFISYRRKDSAAVADQLFDVLTRRNYDVFLDVYSIRGADRFQDELFHRMTDCDVLIQINTTNFMKSRWCREEVEMANMKQIGLVEIIWPDSRLERWSELCHPCYLTPEDFRRHRHKGEKAQLKSRVINAIARDVESVRARNLAARQDNITGEFVQEALKYGKKIIKELYYLLETRANGGLRLFLPAIGIPDSFDYYESLEFKTLLHDKNLEIYLLYDELRIMERWIKHLDWLDSSLEVKSIKKKDFESWIKKH